MILKKEFYFVRHGQTDFHTAKENEDISLNDIGKQQALLIAPNINRLTFQTICCSPLKRAKETKELLIPAQSHQEIAELHECTGEVWKEMTCLNTNAYMQGSPPVRNFLDQAKNGINKSLEHPGPVLIIAHGGIHWALCYWMNLNDHNWVIDNCKPVHFFYQSNWRARLI